MTRARGRKLLSGVVFASPIFLYLFLPLVLAAYWVCPRTGRNLLLVVASLAFYAWGEGVYVLLMLASVAFNFGVALGVAPGARARGIVLAFGVGGNLLALAYYKYWGFALDSFVGFAGWEVEVRQLHLPLGISFFTFQAISYLVDVYRGEARAQLNPINLALYITLFPQLIAGPIVRYESVAAAFERRRSTLQGAASGVELFIVGLGKKTLLADPLGEVADAVFALESGALSLELAWLGTLAFALQVYFDFSGYTDMARGLGRIFGFEFPINFRLPYLSLSVREFWRRWHISLSTWFRDYLYIPLGGSHASPARQACNLWIVFLLCGLWHGASWTFVAWGAVHGAWITLEHSPAGRWLAAAPSALRWGATFLFLLCSWTFFRADSLAHSGALLSAMFGGGAVAVVPPAQLLDLLDTRFWIELGLALAIALGGHELLRAKLRASSLKAGSAWRLPLRFAGLMAVLTLCFARLALDQYNPFLYFRF